MAPQDALRWFDRPSLDRPIVVAAFEGWNDAGDSASAAAAYLAERWLLDGIAEIDPEEFFDFTVRRPLVSLGAGAVRHIEWPVFEFRYGSPAPDRDLIVGFGPEPHFRWRRYTDHVVRLLLDVGVQRVALVGAYLADVLYSRPVRVVGFASEPALAERLAVEPSGYEGPTGIVGVLEHHAGSLGRKILQLDYTEIAAHGARPFII